MNALSVKNDLMHFARPSKAVILARFFKNGKGEYGEGDVFVGITVPQIRSVVKQFRDLPIPDVIKLLHSKEHEFRLCALLILVSQFVRHTNKNETFDQYLDNTKWINNWDLVDLSAPQIVGGYLLSRDRKILYTLAASKSLWERRIAMISCFTFIRNKESKDVFAVAEILVHDSHDLIHKAVGWMLREVGKNCGIEQEREFLDRHYKTMPRTMLRYAIERFPDILREKYMRR